MNNKVKLPTRANVEAAGRRIAGLVLETPLRRLQLGGDEVWLKCESLQTGGSFKLRGASNRLALLDEGQRKAGVVAFSSGNHAQGVAIAARRLGVPATIVMPSDAPAPKIQGTRSQGAEIVFYDRASEDRVAIASSLAADRGAVVVPSFDDPDIIAGQGTAGLEILAQCPEPVRQIVVCCGGGGLAAGLALACPDAAMVVVEPEGWDDMGKGLAEGHIVPVAPDAPPTACDALQTPVVSPLTFGVLQARNATGIAVTEVEVKAAVRFAWQELQLMVEPGGAAALAATLSGKIAFGAGTVIMLTGGNMDPALHSQWVN
jgi:threonine dehydratase